MHFPWSARVSPTCQNLFHQCTSTESSQQSANINTKVQTNHMHDSMWTAHCQSQGLWSYPRSFVDEQLHCDAAHSLAAWGLWGRKILSGLKHLASRQKRNESSWYTNGNVKEYLRVLLQDHLFKLLFLLFCWSRCHYLAVVFICLNETKCMIMIAADDSLHVFIGIFRLIRLRRYDKTNDLCLHLFWCIFASLSEIIQYQSWKTF